MRKIFIVLLLTTSLPLASISSPAYAGDGGGIAAGLFGGLALGTLFGVAAASPRYAPPPPPYLAPYPASACFWTQGQPYWDGYRGAWIYPRVQVCQ